MLIEKVEIGLATLYCADCLEVMKTFEDKLFSAAITDPPYGIGISGQKLSINKNPKHNRKYHEDLGWDSAIPEEEVFRQIERITKEQIIWGGNYFVEHLRKGNKGWLYWDKGQRGLTMSDGELAYTSLGKPLRAITMNRGEIAQDGSEHPTQKPVKLMRWCIDQLEETETIFDPFMGSGSTGVAAVSEGKKFVGIELSPKYFGIARRRIERAQQQQRLF